MKNLVKQTPFDPLVGRNKYICSRIKSMGIAGKDVLDIGCGYGWLENFLLNNGVKSITAIDTDEPLLSELKMYLGNERLVVRNASATKLPFRNNSFDLVTSFEVIEHIPAGEEHTMLKEIYRVLRRGGFAVISTPHDSLIGKLSDPAYWLIKHRHYNKLTLEEMCKAVGFRVVGVKTIGKILNLLALEMLYFYKWVLRKKFVVPKFIVPILDREFEGKDGFLNIFLVASK